MRPEATKIPLDASLKKALYIDIGQLVDTQIQAANLQKLLGTHDKNITLIICDLWNQLKPDINKTIISLCKNGSAAETAELKSIAQAVKPHALSILWADYEQKLSKAIGGQLTIDTIVHSLLKADMTKQSSASAPAKCLKGLKVIPVFNQSYQDHGPVCLNEANNIASVLSVVLQAKNNLETIAKGPTGRLMTPALAFALLETSILNHLIALKNDEVLLVSNATVVAATLTHLREAVAAYFSTQPTLDSVAIAFLTRVTDILKAPALQALGLTGSSKECINIQQVLPACLCTKTKYNESLIGQARRAVARCYPDAAKVPISVKNALLQNEHFIDAGLSIILSCTAVKPLQALLAETQKPDFDPKRFLFDYDFVRSVIQWKKMDERSEGYALNLLDKINTAFLLTPADQQPSPYVAMFARKEAETRHDVKEAMKEAIKTQLSALRP
jgi:hypothetical protein